MPTIPEVKVKMRGVTEEQQPPVDASLQLSGVPGSGEPAEEPSVLPDLEGEPPVLPPPGASSVIPAEAGIQSLPPDDDISGAYLEDRQIAHEVNQPSVQYWLSQQRITESSTGDFVDTILAEEKPAPEALQAEKAWASSQQRGGQSKEQIAAEQGGLKDPSIDPVSAAVGGASAPLKLGLSQGLKLMPTLARAVSSSVASAIGEYPVGMATEKVEEVAPALSVPFSVLAGMVSGATLESSIEKGIVSFFQKKGVRPSARLVKDAMATVKTKLELGQADDSLTASVARDLDAEFAPRREARLYEKGAELQEDVLARHGEIFADLESDLSAGVRTAAGKLDRNPSGVKTLASAITAELSDRGRIDLRGKIVKSAEDVASLAQVYRDPRMETFRIIYTRGDEIVAHEGVSSRMPNFSAAFLDANKAKALYEIRDRMQRLGSDGYYLLHNHPSGRVESSAADQALTQLISEKVPGFRAHVVINSGEYLEIRSVTAGPGVAPALDIQQKVLPGLPEGWEDPILKASIRSDALGVPITDAEQVALIGKQFEAPEGYVTLIYRDAGGTVRAIQEAPVNLMLQVDQATNFLRGQARGFGALDIVAYGGKIRGTGERVLPQEVEDLLVKNGTLLDVVYSNVGEVSERTASVVRERGTRPERMFGRDKGQYPAKRVEEERSAYLTQEPGAGYGDDVIGKGGKADIPAAKTPKAEGGELIYQKESKTFVSSDGKEYTGTDASGSIDLLTDQEFKQFTGFSKEDFRKKGGSVYFVPATQREANSIHEISGEIALSDGLKSDKGGLREKLIHELTHWGQIQRGEAPKTYYASPEESIRGYMEYLSDPAEVKARFNAAGKSDKEYDDYMEQLNWAKSAEAGKLKEFEIGEVRTEIEKKWRMPLTYLRQEIDQAKLGRDYRNIDRKQLKANIDELERTLNPPRTGKEIAKREDVNDQLAVVGSRKPISDEDASNVNELYLDIQSKWTRRRLGAGDRRLKENEIEYYHTPVMRVEIRGKVDPETGKRAFVNPILIERKLREVGIVGFSTGPNEIVFELNRSNVEKFQKIGKDLQAAILPNPTRPPESGGRPVVREPSASYEPSAPAYESQIELSLAEVLGDSSKPLIEISRASKAQARAFLQADLENLPEKAINVNFANIQSEDDVMLAIAKVAEIYGPEIQQARRGKQSLEQTERLASLMNMTPAELLSRRKGQAFNAEEAVAARKILISSAERLAEFARKIQSGMATGIDKAAFQKQLAVHYAIQAQVSGMTAEAGRALSAFRVQARATEGKLKQIDELMKGLDRRVSTDKLAEMIAGIDSAEGLSSFVRKAYRATSWDMLYEAWINGLLSGPATHVSNVISNALTAVWQIPERALAAGIGKLSGHKEIELQEAIYQAYGLLEGTKDAFRLAGKAFLKGEGSDVFQKTEGLQRHAITAENLRETLIGKAIRKSISPDFLEAGGIPARFADAAGTLVRGSSRLLTAEDEFFKAVGYRMELRALAYREAHGMGLEGPAAARKMAEILADPPDHIQLAAIDAARYQTFTKPLGEAGRYGMLYLNSPAMRPLRIIVPFVQTPTNILKFFGERTPLAFASRNVRADIMAGGARRDLALARVSMGSAAMAAGMYLTAQGLVTGGGPKDPELRQAMQRTGWQPYSLKIGDKYYSYNRFEPLGMTLGIAADTAEILGQVGEEDAKSLVMAGVIAVAKNTTSKTWLKGMSSAVDALDDPDRYAEKFVQGFTKSLVPGIVASVERSVDPEVRETHSIHGFWQENLNAIQSRVPGWSDSLPAKRNLWGEKIIGDALGPNWLSPVYSTEAKVAPVDEEMQKLKLGIPVPKRTQTFQGETIELSEWEHDRLLVLMNTIKMPQTGQPLKPSLDLMVTKDPGYKGLRKDQKEIRIRQMVHQAAAMARMELFNESEEIRWLVEQSRAQKMAQGGGQ